MPEQRCIDCGNRVPWLSFWGNLIITVYKITVGVLGNSKALIADGLHSFTDVIGTGVIIFSRHISNREADDEHPYGHGKAEFLGSIFIYIVLIGIAITIFVGGLVVILQGDLKPPRTVTLFAAGVSVMYNVIMYTLGQCAGHKNNSPAILANSNENRADAISSFAVILGIAASILVHPICDPITAMIVGVIIFTNSVIQLRGSVSGVMDRSLPADVVRRIREVTLARDGVIGVDFIKTRQTGSDYWVDLGILVREDLDVAGSDKIASAVRNELMRRSEKFRNVEVYVAPARRKAGRLRGLLRRGKQQEQPGEAG